MKKLKLLTYLLFIILLINACSKDDCPKGINYTYKYYNISENIKKTFPYQFKDTQVWINVNTNDTLHYILKDTVSSYDTTLVSPTDGCVENNYTFSGQYTFQFNCLENVNLNYNYTYGLYKGFGFDHSLFFSKVYYVEYDPKLQDINNFGIVYKDIYVSKFFAENDSVGIVRITLNNAKLYRIK